MGTVTAAFVNFLNQPTSMISVIGHSLGAHAAVSVLKYFFKLLSANKYGK